MIDVTKKPLLILTGPTAAGKTAISIQLAKHLDGEIISADSMQVYRGMDIGSAKITKEEMQGVPHHLIDILDPTEPFNVMIFKEKAMAAIEEIYAKGKLPIIAGGTGFYIQSVLYDIDFTKETDTSLREKLEEMAKTEEGKAAVYDRLKEVDPDYAQELSPNNVKRAIRALEFYLQNGYPMSVHNTEQREKTSPFLFKYYVLDLPREVLYERINRRVDVMMDSGLLSEIEKLFHAGYTETMVSMQGIGYKELLAYLQGHGTLEEAVELIKKNTRHFAKRQGTWFRREKAVSFVDKTRFTSDEEIAAYLAKDFEYCLGGE